MMFGKNNKHFSLLKGPMFASHHEFFYPLPEKLYPLMNLNDRLLAWSEERDNYYFTLGNLYWENDDYTIIKNTLNNTSLKALTGQITNNTNQSIRTNTLQFDKMLRTLIALNEIVWENNGYLFVESQEIDTIIERYLKNRHNNKTFNEQYNNLTLNDYPHSQELIQWLTQQEISKKTSITRRKGADITLPTGNIKTTTINYQDIEIMPV